MALPDRRYKRSPFGLYNDLAQILLNLISIGFYIGSTYYKEEEPDWIIAVDYVFVSFFFLDFLFRFYIAENRYAYSLINRMAFFFATSSLIDLVTIIPIMMRELIIAIDSEGSLGTLKVLRVLRVLRILRAYKIRARANMSRKPGRSQDFFKPPLFCYLL